MSSISKLSLAALLASALLAAACGGGGARVQSQTTTTTMGQELKDLDDAYQREIISQSEYDKAKKAILKRYKK